MKPGRTFDDLTITLSELAAALDDVVLGDLEGADREAVQGAWLAAAEACRAADDLAVRVRSFLTDTILRSPAGRP